MPQQLHQTVILLFALIIALFANAECLASCGDWLADSDQEMESHEPRNVRSESKRLPQSESEQEDRQAPGRCNGPQCHQAPIAPMQPTPLDIHLTDRDADLYNHQYICVCNATSPRWFLLSDSARDGFRNDLERPPQSEM